MNLGRPLCPRRLIFGGRNSIPLPALQVTRSERLSTPLRALRPRYPPHLLSSFALARFHSIPIKFCPSQTADVEGDTQQLEMAALKRSVLITGCSAGGIGAGLAEAFRDKGYHVFATLRNPSKLPSALSNAPNVTPLTLDVLSQESIAAAVTEVTKHTGGRLDVLVNNSGQNFIRPALDVPIEEGKKLFDLNFWAPLAMVQAFAPLLIQARGIVVNQSSAAGYVPMPFGSQY
jgi:hypothetical protein